MKRHHFQSSFRLVDASTSRDQLEAEPEIFEKQDRRIAVVMNFSHRKFADQSQMWQVASSATLATREGV